MQVDPETLSALEQALGMRVTEAAVAIGGFSGSRCWSVGLVGGERVFVKVGGDVEAILGNRNEAAVLESIVSAHLPSFIGLFDDGRLLVTEDLGLADWSPRPNRMDGLWAAIIDIGSHIGPSSLWHRVQGPGRDTWVAAMSDDRFMSAVGLEHGWMQRYGPIVGAASAQADGSGDRLVHGDLGPGNWCRDAAGTWRFVDWAAAHRGNPVIDEVIASVRLTRLSGAPVASTNVTDHAELVAFVGGRFASELLDVDWSLAPQQARIDRVGDIRASLSLAAHLLELPMPSFS